MRRLALTGVVSVLHMVFDMLAFKNDIKFWRNQKSLEGLSVGTVFINCFCSVSKTRSATLFRVMGESDTAIPAGGHLPLPVQLGGNQVRPKRRL